MDYRILKDIQEEHKKHGDLIPKIENLFNEIRGNIDLKKLKDLKKLLKNLKIELEEHFFKEESKIFPKIINKNNEMLIIILEKEHIEILNLLDKLDKNIEKILSGEYIWVEFRYNIKEFLHTLNDHILKEDYQLIPSI